MKILVTGGAGYLGAVLLPKLLARHHQIRVIDAGYFGIGHLRGLQPSIELIREDIRRVVSDEKFRNQLLEGCECVIQLAALSNDPSADLNPQLAVEINTDATVALAKSARERKLKFLFSSSCSIYGGTSDEIDENGSQDPLTTYAISKAKAEEELLALCTDNWSPVILRNGTLFGYSAKMRFDLVVNIFSLYSVLHNQIKVFGEGLQWRPFLHVGDCARAFVFFAEKKNYRHICYNVAHENMRVVDVVRIFQQVNPSLQVEHIHTLNEDHRDYRVTTNRLRQEGFSTRIGVDIGSEEITEAIVAGLIPDPESIYYQNAKWLRELSLKMGKSLPWPKSYPFGAAHETDK